MTFLPFLFRRIRPGNLPPPGAVAGEPGPGRAIIMPRGGHRSGRRRARRAVPGNRRPRMRLPAEDGGVRRRGRWSLPGEGVFLDGTRSGRKKKRRSLFDTKMMERGIRLFLNGMGPVVPPGVLRDTPRLVAEAWADELLAGYRRAEGAAPRPAR